MRWFAWQRGVAGERVPCLFDEHPKMTPSMSKDLDWKSLRPIPAEFADASLAELVVWAEGTG